MKRKILSVIAVCLLLSILTGCGGDPEYIFRTRQERQQGNVLAYADAWCGISGDKITNITKNIESIESGYTECETYLMMFSLDPGNDAPSEWNLKDGSVGVYFIPDEDLFRTQLSKMAPDYSGEIWIRAVLFGDYAFISIGSQDPNEDTAYAIFHGDKKLKVPTGINLKEFDDILVIKA